MHPKENSPIWFNKALQVKDLYSKGAGTMSEHLGMEFTELGPDFLRMRMPVDHRTVQPFGLLHGGASCTLAETIGSVCSHLLIDPEQFNCVGLEINANHIRSVRKGYVTGTGRPIHVGRTTHIWDIQVHDEQGRLVCISRLTVAILEKK